MSDQPGTESLDDDLGSYSIDDATDAGSAQEELLDASEGDNEPWSPPDQQPRNTEWGTTASEQAQDETIDQRIAQEVPDPDSAYGAPDNESGLDRRPGGPRDRVSGEGLEPGEGPEDAAMHIVED
ncbi:adenosine deaminase [Nostocoides sp. HKS02]|uniref:adenosine deaminase n=1 Tax=Nostocoides sp. HKS02 TaxID=1813880 RepID=UPI001E3E1CFD|nr:adenosine deaminase [Tetrasphaera sp. HKS02]